MDAFQKAADNKQLSFFSPAKVNFFFRTLYKREDGFHEIASLYQAIDLCDRLQISLSDVDLLTCTDSSLILNETNLVFKALAVFRKKTGSSLCFQMHLEKNIPMEAGLGGGSSNAATALFAFCKLSGFFPSLSVLRQWGSEIGSDVPFFFSSGTAYATGRGEILKDLEPRDPISFWIAKPTWGLSTAKVYAACSPSTCIQRNPLEDLDSFLSGKSPFYNDLEEPAFFLSPPLKEMKNKLLQLGFEKVILCGSGTSFFCIGSCIPLESSYIRFFPVTTIKRKDEGWYEL